LLIARGYPLRRVDLTKTGAHLPEAVRTLYRGRKYREGRS